MKSFYDMWRIIEGMDYDAWLEKPYQDDHAGDNAYFTTILGEGEKDAPFSLEVEIDGGSWKATGGIWVLGYVPDGSENPASKPVAETPGQKDRWGRTSDQTGTHFGKPGRRLELLPASIRDAAIKWVEDQVQKEIENYEPEDPRNYREPDDYNPDPDGDGYWDNYWNHGPGRDR